MKKKLNLRERAVVALTTVFALTAGFMPSIIRAATSETTTPMAPAGSAAETTTISMRVTAFSSSVDETDSTPFVTANGTRVHDGIVATNLLPFGTRIQIPDLFGEKIFVVEDRMAKHFKKTIDIWMPSKNAALRFGVSLANVVVLPPAQDLAISER